MKIENRTFYILKACLKSVLSSKRNLQNKWTWINFDGTVKNEIGTGQKETEI